ncbi:MAG TPA: Hsp20/alpha crystallin family protein [Candidatus Limnocylindrales bacterium]|nr:Hsp20/alpha crystallin family protein [Candidatus Limnocylindrales bacterium]
MSIVRRRSPFTELESLRAAMDRLFEDSLLGSNRYGSAYQTPMPVNVRSTGDELEIEAALPGVKPEDVELTVEGGTLVISATSRSDEDDERDGYLVREIRRGSFARTIALPTGYEPDRASARFDDGVLRVAIPKAEQLRPRQIRINAQSDEAHLEQPHVEAGSGG